MAQLPLELPEPPVRAVVEDRWRRFLDEINSVVRDIGPKEVAHECDRAPSSFDAALAERERHSLKARDLLVVLLMDRSERLVTHLAALCGGDFVPWPKVTPEQAVENLRAELRRVLSEEQARAVEERALGRGR